LQVTQLNEKRNEALLIATSVAVVAGMVIAALLIAWWRFHPSLLTSEAGFFAAVALCPPFMLLRQVGGVEDSVLSLVMTEGTIVIANGSLYAGLAAFVYWALTSCRPRRS
jgi:hypothetical protein